MQSLNVFTIFVLIGLSFQFEQLPGKVAFETIKNLEERALLNYMIEHKYLSVEDIPDRIIGGADADDTDAPFQIALYQKYFGIFKRFLCGGSLISGRTVLSAGHCVIKSAIYSVQYGSNDRTSSSFPNIGIAKIILHPEFDLATVQNDLALFIMNNQVSPSNNVRSIDLQDSGLQDNTTVTLYGFGLTNGLGSTPAKKLQKTDLTTLSEETCEKYIKSLGISKHPGMLCAQSPTASACNGDSGGPLVVTETRKQVGIVSFGTRFCPVGSINVYTNVSHYVSWINQNMVN